MEAGLLRAALLVSALELRLVCELMAFPLQKGRAEETCCSGRAVLGMTGVCAVRGAEVEGRELCGCV